MFSLLNVRKKALARHAKNKELIAKLTTGQNELSEYRAQHLIEKDALEKAYQLVLD